MLVTLTTNFFIRYKIFFSFLKGLLIKHLKLSRTALLILSLSFSKAILTKSIFTDFS